MTSCSALSEDPALEKKIAEDVVEDGLKLLEDECLPPGATSASVSKEIDYPLVANSRKMPIEYFNNFNN